MLSPTKIRLCALSACNLIIAVAAAHIDSGPAAATGGRGELSATASSAALSPTTFPSHGLGVHGHLHIHGVDTVRQLGVRVRVNFIKLFGERHTATTYLEQEVIAPRLASPELLLTISLPSSASVHTPRTRKDCKRLASITYS